MKKQEDNFLERIPHRVESFRWTENEEGIVTLEVDNRGFFNRLFQLLLKKPKVSMIHLDEMGSFLWKELDGKRNLILLGEDFERKFGERAQPLYERLAKYMQILHSYGLIAFTDEKR